MDASALVERLASSNAWEVRAVEEEICRRGRDLVPTLLAFAQQQSSQAPQASEEAVLRQRRAAIRALELAGILDAPAARETAIAWARSGSPPLVLASLTVLGRLSDDDTRTLLVGLLADSNEQVRCAAAQALGERGGGPAAADLVQALRFYEGHHPAELLALVRAVENCGTEGLTALAELFDSGAASDLQVALQSWTQLRHPEALRYIGKLLHHPHLANDQRQRVLRWWADLAAHYPGDGKPILDWLASHPSLPTPLLTEALRALSVSSCDQTQLGPIAESYLTHDSPEVRVFALACLRGTPQRSASDKLLAMLRHNARSSQERLQAAETLLRWQNPDAIPALLALLDDESASAALREGAAALLMRYGSPAVREMVFRQLQRWPAEMLRDLVHSLRPQKQTLLLLADACHCNKLPYDKCGDYLLEALAPWAAGSPEPYDAFVRLQHRRTDRNKERP
jgi:HEAT repeat protein